MGVAVVSEGVGAAVAWVSDKRRAAWVSDPRAPLVAVRAGAVRAAVARVRGVRVPAATHVVACAGAAGNSAAAEGDCMDSHRSALAVAGSDNVTPGACAPAGAQVAACDGVVLAARTSAAGRVGAYVCAVVCIPVARGGAYPLTGGVGREDAWTKSRNRGRGTGEMCGRRSSARLQIDVEAVTDGAVAEASRSSGSFCR